MPNSYIPTRDGDLAPWADNFRDLIVATPGAYGLLAADGTAIATVVDAWDAAYATAINPSTRTPATIAAKDSAKGAMVPILRFYAQTIKLNQGVSNELKVGLGIHVNDAGPTPVPVPSTAPALNVDFTFHLGASLRVRDTSTPTSNAKPPGVLGGLVMYKVGVAVATTPEGDHRDSIETKTPFRLAFDAADVGKICTVWQKWYNRKGEFGPLSDSVNFVIT